LAQTAVDRISGGALNAQSVSELALTLGMSDRHLRRAIKREHGTTPARLALTQRLRAATELLADRERSITDVAFASGFGSVRRFNAAFRTQFGMSPTAWRRTQDTVPGPVDIG
jgi:AraC family transcriptional regulator of adaptative response / DNA-3-methyladenine glycosylase II